MTEVTNGYCTVEELSSHIASANNQGGVDMTHRTDEYARAINSASRRIDTHCHRVFYATASSQRVFVAASRRRVELDDCHTITAVQTDPSANATWSQTWTSSQYQTEPHNGVSDGRGGWPVTKLRAIESLTFPQRYAQPLVRVTATWGWAAVPDDVHQACLMLAHRLVRRIESPEGVAGFGEFGAVRVRPMDPDVEELLRPFVKVFA